MPLRFDHHPELPLLAWCAHAAPADPVVRVRHGSGVEVRDDAFVEGAWDGDFEAFDFASAPLLCGTGGAAREGGVSFHPATDRQSPLYAIANPRGWFVSNSPMFAMATAGEEPDPAYPFYSYDILAFYRAGLHCASGPLPLASGRKLRMSYTHAIERDGSGALRYVPPPPGPAPTDYTSYRELLGASIQRVLENGRAAARRGVRYEPLASLSKGYDSTACAVLARDAGCREAMTFRDHTRDDPHRDDGRENAARLGMHCTVHERYPHLLGVDLDEAEVGWFMHSQVAWSGAADRLRGGLLVLGRAGELAWDPVFADIAQLATPAARFPGMLAASELRLRIGYGTVSPPAVGLLHGDRIQRLAWSEEMRPWSVGGDYDRPLPRRIAEEGGLPRESFGQKAMAASHVHLTGRKFFSEKAWADYRAFVERAHTEVPAWRRGFWRAALDGRHAAWGLSPGSSGPSTRLKRRFPFLSAPLKPRKRLGWEVAFTLAWSFDAVRGRYEID